MPIYQVDHETVYDYRLPVLYSNHLAHMLPRTVNRQNWLSHSIEVEPNPTIQQERIDIFGNRVLAFSIEQEHTHFRFKTTGIVDVQGEEPPKQGETMKWEDVANFLERPTSDETLDAAMYAYASPFAKFDESVRNYALESFEQGRPIFDAAYELMTRIYTDCKYTPGATRIGAQPQEIRLPGLCTPDDRLLAFTAFALPLRERLPPHSPLRRPTQTRRSRRDPRLGQHLHSWPRLGRTGPHQQCAWR